MSLGYGIGRLKVNELEAWLERVLVPVEPSSRFAQRLKARLVTLSRAGPSSGWITIGVVLTGVVVAVAWMGLALRVALGVLAVLGLVQSRRRREGVPHPNPSPAGRPNTVPVSSREVPGA